MSSNLNKIRARGLSTTSAGTAGLLFVVNLAAGCACLQPAPLKEPIGTGTTQGEAMTIEPDTPAVSAARLPPETATTHAPVGLKPALAAVEATHEPHHVSRTPSEDVAIKPVVASVTPSVTLITGPVVEKIDLPASTTPAETAATPLAKVVPPSTVQAQKKETAIRGAAKPETSPPLDVKSLETRLKETKAIGVFTKLTLKNQIDDLLNQFRAFYQGQLKSSLAELRRSYDSLLLKVISLLRDADPPLAHAILASREAIWSILADPTKFATL